MRKKNAMWNILDLMRLKLENEKQVLEDMIREMGENNVLRDDTINKLKEVKKQGNLNIDSLLTDEKHDINKEKENEIVCGSQVCLIY